MDLDPDPESKRVSYGVIRILTAFILIAANELQDRSVICKYARME